MSVSLNQYGQLRKSPLQGCTTIVNGSTLVFGLYKDCSTPFLALPDPGDIQCTRPWWDTGLPDTSSVVEGPHPLHTFLSTYTLGGSYKLIAIGHAMETSDADPARKCCATQSWIERRQAGTAFKADCSAGSARPSAARPCTSFTIRARHRRHYIYGLIDQPTRVATVATRISSE